MWTWPLDVVRVTSPYSLLRRHPVTRVPQPHTGVDLAATTGTPVRAIADGTVTRSERHTIAGHWIWIDHGSGIVSRYHHLSQRDVVVGWRVRAGERIGLAGATGRVTGPHLHHEIRVHGIPRDPMPWLRQRITPPPTPPTWTPAPTSEEDPMICLRQSETGPGEGRVTLLTGGRAIPIPTPADYAALQAAGIPVAGVTRAFYELVTAGGAR